MTDDSSMSEELSLHIADTMEFTLEDTLGILKELKLERDEELEATYDEQINNRLFNPLSKSKDLTDKQQQFTLSFMNEIASDKPDEYPIPKTMDMFTNVITGLTDQIKNSEECVAIANENLKQKENDVTRLKEKLKGFDKMKEACLATNKIIASKTYEQELHITNELFKEVKNETHKVVELLFPEDDHMKNFLAILCSAYFTSGDDIYVDLTPEFADAANFLLEAGLITYHRYDENKARLIDL